MDDQQNTVFKISLANFYINCLDIADVHLNLDYNRQFLRFPPGEARRMEFYVRVLNSFISQTLRREALGEDVWDASFPQLIPVMYFHQIEIYVEVMLVKLLFLAAPREQKDYLYEELMSAWHQFNQFCIRHQLPVYEP